MQRHRPLASRAPVSLFPEPLRISAFRYFWLARLAATIAQMAMVIVIGWQVYDIARHTMGLKEAALRLGIIGLVQFVPLFLLDPGDGLDCGPPGPALDRAGLGRPRARLRPGARSFHLDRPDDARNPLHGRSSAWCRPRLRRACAWRARAEFGAARDPAARDRSLLDGVAGRRRSSGRRRAAISTLTRLMRLTRRAAALFAIAFLGASRHPARSARPS